MDIISSNYSYVELVECVCMCVRVYIYVCVYVWARVYVYNGCIFNTKLWNTELSLRLSKVSTFLKSLKIKCTSCLTKKLEYISECQSYWLIGINCLIFGFCPLLQCVWVYICIILAELWCMLIMEQQRQLLRAIEKCNYD